MITNLKKSSRSLTDLTPGFRTSIEKLLSDLAAKGYNFTPFYTRRTPWDQARLWRQGRTLNEIQNTIEKLRSGNANFLASILEEAGPQDGRRVTNALPGYSWHQWGEAVDCMYVVNGKAVWDNDSAYKLYADAARAAGLTAGYYFSFKDMVHVQAMPHEVSSTLTALEINDGMLAIYNAP